METSVRKRGEETFEFQVGQRIRDVRLTQGLAQIELARRLANFGVDWHQTTVAKTELGLRPLRVNEVAALASALDVPLEELLRTPAQQRPVTPEQRRLQTLRQRETRLRGELVQAQLTLTEAEARLRAVEALLSECVSQIHSAYGEDTAGA